MRVLGVINGVPNFSMSAVPSLGAKHTKSSRTSRPGQGDVWGSTDGPPTLHHLVIEQIAITGF